MFITRKYLRENPDKVFVFGDNLLRKGKKGGAVLRDEPNTYGFVTKKAPNNLDSSFYRPSEYKEVFRHELNDLINVIEANPDKTFLISKIGSGLANKYNIFEKVIKPGLAKLKKYPNVEFLFKL